jgi:streptogramin lyase
VWIGRDYPAAVGRFDGRRLRWTPIPLTAGRDGVHLSDAGGAVWFSGGQTVGRLVAASGTVQTYPVAVSGARELSVVTADRDRGAWSWRVTLSCTR